MPSRINCCFVIGLSQASQISPSAEPSQNRAMPRRMPKADSENLVKIDHMLKCGSYDCATRRAGARPSTRRGWSTRRRARRARGGSAHRGTRCSGRRGMRSCGSGSSPDARRRRAQNRPRLIYRHVRHPLHVRGTRLLVIWARYERLATGTVLSLAGLILDIGGASTLAGGLLLSRATHVRQQHLDGRLLGNSRSRVVSRFPLMPAPRIGSANPNEMSPTAVQELVDATWGLVLLVLGFVGQILGSIYSIPR
jgi:hypothetical protein